MNSGMLYALLARPAPRRNYELYIKLTADQHDSINHGGMKRKRSPRAEAAPERLFHRKRFLLGIERHEASKAGFGG